MKLVKRQNIAIGYNLQNFQVSRTLELSHLYKVHITLFYHDSLSIVHD